MNQIKVTILRPSGNDTALVEGIPERSQDKKKINDFVMFKYPNVEQVGFYDLENKRLEMAGREFCANAARAFAWVLSTKLGMKDFVLNVSGIKEPILAKVSSSNKVYIQFPVKRKTTFIKQLSKDLYEIRLEGIQILINTNEKSFKQDKKQITQDALRLLDKYGLRTQYKASGIMYIKQANAKNFVLKPIVWVRDIETLFYETACGSGSVALGFLQSFLLKKEVAIKVKQPSGRSIDIKIIHKNSDSMCAQISGEVKILDSKTLGNYSYYRGKPQSILSKPRVIKFVSKFE